MKIAVAGTAYVGLSIVALLSQENEVVALDVLPENVAQINQRQSPIKGAEIKDFFHNKSLNLTATLGKHQAHEGVDNVLVATPIDFAAAIKRKPICNNVPPPRIFM